MDRINKLKQNTQGGKASEGKQDCSVDGVSNLSHISENCSCDHESMEKVSVMSIKQDDGSYIESGKVSPDVAEKKISPLTRLVPSLGEFKFLELPWKKTLSLGDIITSIYLFKFFSPLLSSEQSYPQTYMYQLIPFKFVAPLFHIIKLLMWLFHSVQLIMAYVSYK